MVIVAWKRNFSPPRLVLFVVLRLSLPPKAPPKDSSDCCNRIATTRIIERIICNVGNDVMIISMLCMVSEKISKKN